MTHHHPGPSDLDAVHADRGIRVAALAHGRITVEQLAAAERTRLYHVNKLPAYRNLVSASAANANGDAAGAQAS